MNIIVTGSAGFIGYHLSKRLLDLGHSVFGIDNLNDYYSVALKQARIDDLKKHKFSNQFNFIRLDLVNRDQVLSIFQNTKPDVVYHLAAQAGVRYSIENPSAYIQANIVGFQNVIDACVEQNVRHFLYASSSSVYGGNNKYPSAESDSTNNPISLYAATKLANELVAQAYFNLFKLRSSGFRFFTVYGPWGRPDMALFKFTQQILKGDIIELFNAGDMKRDFTYIDDIIDGLLAALERKEPTHEIFNLGKGKPNELVEMLNAISSYFKIEYQFKHLPMQLGDVHMSHADVSKANASFGYSPKTSLIDGISQFLKWYEIVYSKGNFNG